MYLIAEYCKGPFYMGWHLYLRDHRVFRRNNDGSWGWVRMSGWSHWKSKVVAFLDDTLGISINGDGTRDGDGIAEFARQFPIKGRRCGGKLRGCLEIVIDEYGDIKLANPSFVADAKGRAAQL